MQPPVEEEKGDLAADSPSDSDYFGHLGFQNPGMLPSVAAAVTAQDTGGVDVDIDIVTELAELRGPVF